MHNDAQAMRVSLRMLCASLLRSTGAWLGQPRLPSVSDPAASPVKQVNIHANG